MVKARNPEDKVSYKTYLFIGWKIQDRVCFLRVAGSLRDLRDLKLPEFRVDL